MNGRVYAPVVEVSFHTIDENLYSAKSVGYNIFGEELNPQNQVLSVTTQKSLDSPAGAFTVTLAGLQWDTRLHPQDVCVISMGYVGDSIKTTVMVGLVDKVERKKSMGGDGKPQTMTVITGRDFGKLFVKDLLKFYPEISGQNAADFFLTDTGWINLLKIFTNDSVMKGSPAQLIWNMMQYIFPKIHDISWTLWDERSKPATKRVVNVKDMIHCTLERINFFMPLMVTADQYEGALWNLMQRAAPQTFTELFIDTRSLAEFWNPDLKNMLVNGDIEQNTIGEVPFRFGDDNAKITLCLRQTPYDSAVKNKLVRHIIQQEDVISEDMYCTDEQHYNLFWAGTSINPLGIDLKRVAPPMLNVYNAKVYGLSPLEVTVDGMEVTDQLTLEGMSRNYTGKLKAWFENNHTFYQGQLDIRGRAEVKIGQMVNYGNQYFIKEFYVESVTQNFTVYEGWTTSLTLTRGMDIPSLVDSGQYAWSPPAPPAPAPPADTFYTVVKGDTLWSIAKRTYGNPLQWRKIWNANSGMLIARDRRNATDNGHWIYPGQKLTIPA
jgi:hypothetical protein